MKLKKSFYSIVLTILFIVNSISIMIPQTTFAASTTNVTPEVYGEALKRISNLGMIDNGNANPNDVVIRGQLCKAIVVAAGLDDTAKSRIGSTIFSDIDVTSEISGYVNTAIDSKLMSGMADGKFHPEQAVTFAQACTTIVRALGYTDQDVPGIWPANYINKASALNLTDGIKLKKNDGLPVWAAAVMFDRLLNTNVKGSQTVTYSKSISLYDDYIILDNPNTLSSISSGSVLTDKGVLYTSDINTNLEVGSTYRLNVTNGNIKTVYGKVRNTQSYTVNNAVDNTVYYNNGNTLSSMTLPSAGIKYYHNDQPVSDLSSILKPDTEIVFNYNTDNSGYDYAVIVDPIYSNPQIALNFDPNSNTLGDITFDSNTPIIRSGQNITKNDIRDYDAVYSVTDANGKNRTIQVFDNIIEGNITGFLANGTSSKGIVIDNVNYNYGTDIDLSNLSSLKVGELVSATKGYDGNIIAVRSIDHKTGNLIDGIIVGNSKTINSLPDNHVKISINGNTPDEYTCLSGVGSFEIGAEYSLYADSATKTITKINKKINSVEDYAVSSVSDSIVSYIGDNNDTKTMTFPYVSTYYYNGAKVDYSTALSSIQPYSSIIIGKNSDGTGDLYAVIADPCFSKPQVYKPSNTNLIKQLGNTDYSFIYKDGVYTSDPSNIKVYDVVYFVSDLWNKATYVYDYDKTVVGSITALAPSTINPTSIKVGSTSYDLSQYFDKSKLHNFDAISHSSSGDNFYVGSNVILIMGVDGKVVDLYQR